MSGPIFGWPEVESAHLFAGPWIGEAVAGDDKRPAVIWRIEVNSHWLTIQEHASGQSETIVLHGRMIEGDTAFMLGNRRAVLVDAGHFVLADGDVGDVAAVVFSRPGVAELSARAAYQRYLTRLSH